ncbi:carbohydrate ABC transporter permease [Spirochaetota bacterium]|nr:carbohydrate ABC transporter permease [Spirochaetota bacterium]
MMADYRSEKRVKLIIRAVSAWILAVLIFFPILWMTLTSFKTELQAISIPPLLIFEPTLENFTVIQERSNYFSYAFNSLFLAGFSTIIALALALPAAYAMAFFPGKHTKNLLLWMISTKMLPAVGVLVPIYLIYRNIGLLDSLVGITIIFTLINLPIVVWILYFSFKDTPKEILEACIMDGTSVFQQFIFVLLPINLGGIVSTALLSFVLAWNESFWSINLSANDAGSLATLIASYSSPEGLFWAKLSAASLLTCLPIVVLGWFCQKQIVQGLTFGAVK